MGAAISTPALLAADYAQLEALRSPSWASLHVNVPLEHYMIFPVNRVPVVAILLAVPRAPVEDDRM